MFESQRVGVFIDVQNMFYSAKSLVHGKLDYQKLLEGIVKGRQLVRATCYIVQKADIDQTTFHDALYKFGYDLRVKELKIRDGGEGGKTTARGSWDVGMAVEALNMADKLDTVILCAGNGDFVPLVDSLHDKGCRVEVVSFERSTALELKQAADEFIPIKSEWWFADKKNSSAELPAVASTPNQVIEEDEESIGNRVTEPDPNAAKRAKFGDLA